MGPQMTATARVPALPTPSTSGLRQKGEAESEDTFSTKVKSILWRASIESVDEEEHDACTRSFRDSARER